MKYQPYQQVKQYQHFKHINIINNITILFCCFALFLLACSSPKKGCDDPKATNYSFDADEPCEANLKEGDCPCVYPNLLVGFSPRHIATINGKDSTIAWNKDSTLLNEQKQAYFLQSFSFFISDFQLENKEGKLFTVAETTAIPIKGSSDLITIKNNLLLVQQNGTSNSLGTFRELGPFQAISFNIGLQNPENKADIKNVKMPSHPLNNSEMYKNNALSSAVISYKRAKTQVKADTLVLDGVTKTRVLFSKPKNFTIAQDAILSLHFDYQKLFYNVVFDSDSETVIQQKVLANFKDAFRVVE